MRAFHLASNESSTVKQKQREYEESNAVSSPQDNSQFSLAATNSLRDIIAFCLMMRPVQPNVIQESYTGDKLTGLVLCALQKTCKWKQGDRERFQFRIVGWCEIYVIGEPVKVGQDSQLNQVASRESIIFIGI